MINPLSSHSVDPQFASSSQPSIDALQSAAIASAQAATQAYAALAQVQSNPSSTPTAIAAAQQTANTAGAQARGALQALVSAEQTANSTATSKGQAVPYQAVQALGDDFDPASMPPEAVAAILGQAPAGARSTGGPTVPASLLQNLNDPSSPLNQIVFNGAPSVSSTTVGGLNGPPRPLNQLISLAGTAAANQQPPPQAGANNLGFNASEMSELTNYFRNNPLAVAQTSAGSNPPGVQPGSFLAFAAGLGNSPPPAGTSAVSGYTWNAATSTWQPPQTTTPTAAQVQAQFQGNVYAQLVNQTQTEQTGTILDAVRLMGPEQAAEALSNQWANGIGLSGYTPQQMQKLTNPSEATAVTNSIVAGEATPGGPISTFMANNQSQVASVTQYKNQILNQLNSQAHSGLSPSELNQMSAFAYAQINAYAAQLRQGTVSSAS